MWLVSGVRYMQRVVLSPLNRDALSGMLRMSRSYTFNLPCTWMLVHGMLDHKTVSTYLYAASIALFALDGYKEEVCFLENA